MRKVKYFVAASLDGFISRRDSSTDWIFVDQDYGRSEFFASVDVAVMGRKTYERMLQLSPSQPYFAGMQNYVFSTSVAAGPRGKVTFVSGPAAAWVAGMRAEEGKDIWLAGGGELVRHFIDEQLIDEIGVAVHPRLLGQGSALFPPPYPETQLELLTSKQYASGLVQLFYSVRR